MPIRRRACLSRTLLRGPKPVVDIVKSHAIHEPGYRSKNRCHRERTRTKCFASQTEIQYRRAANKKLIFFKLIGIDVCRLYGFAGSKNGVPWPHFLDSLGSWTRTIGFVFLENDDIHHGPTLGVSADYFGFIINEYFPSPGST